MILVGNMFEIKERTFQRLGVTSGKKGKKRGWEITVVCFNDAMLASQSKIYEGLLSGQVCKRCQQGQGQGKQSGRDLALCAVVGVAAVLAATGVGTKNASLEALAVALEALGSRTAAA